MTKLTLQDMKEMTDNTSWYYYVHGKRHDVSLLEISKREIEILSIKDIGDKYCINFGMGVKYYCDKYYLSQLTSQSLRGLFFRLL